MLHSPARQKLRAFRLMNLQEVSSLSTESMSPSLQELKLTCKKHPLLVTGTMLNCSKLNTRQRGTVRNLFWRGIQVCREKGLFSGHLTDFNSTNGVWVSSLKTPNGLDTLAVNLLLGVIHPSGRRGVSFNRSVCVW